MTESYERHTGAPHVAFGVYSERYRRPDRSDCRRCARANERCRRADAIRTDVSSAPDSNIIENGTDTVVFSIPPGTSPGPQSVAFTPDATAYFVKNYGELTRFSTTGAFTIVAVPRIYGGTVYAHGALWIGAYDGLVRVDTDGKLYFECIQSLSPGNVVVGIARLEQNESQTIFALPLSSANYEQVTSLVSAGGYIYYLTDTQPTGGGSLYRLSPAGVVTKLSQAGGYPSNLVADQGGNLWYQRGKYPNPDTAFLAFYDVHTNRVTGPYAPNLLANLTALFVGPDDNIWLFDKSTPDDYSEFGAYVRHVQTLEPASIVVSAAAPATFTMLETHCNGPWTAASSNPAVALVFPATSANGAFSVTEAG